MLKLGGFRIHKWVSNNPEVLNVIPISERASELLDLDISDSTLHKTLGLCWSIKTDCCRFKVDLPTRPATKRGILSRIASLYEPLGFVAPFLLQPKRLLQRPCEKKFGWDECIDTAMETLWDCWQRDIQGVKTLGIPRCIMPTRFDSNKEEKCVLSLRPLQLAELRAAEYSLLQYVQQHAFPHLYNSLVGKSRSAETQNVNSTNSLRKLSPILLEGLIRVGGRLQNSGLSQSRKHPIILPSQQPVTHCLIKHYHELEGHMGISQAIAIMRQKFWVVKGTAAVKRLVHRCLSCKARSMKPAEQLMAPLPPCRLGPDYAFATTDVDYFGPFFVRDGRESRKRYGCSFSWLKTSALRGRSLLID
ncbi:hypothetical protein CLF_101899 [Clonorchis sinensis]|uniref:Integrase zinc-binding domain-containing protein n=1 Tax=Clonorchis sinensis TaxID=79923 RepID=G7Y6U0_CLOSI|nr:hypothetical protein CLF_101899 [Clonorchis sinensis]